MGVKGMDVKIRGMVVTQVIDGTCAWDLMEGGYGGRNHGFAWAWRRWVIN